MLVEGLEGDLEGEDPFSGQYDVVLCPELALLVIHACTEISWGPGWGLLKDVKIAYSSNNKT